MKKQFFLFSVGIFILMGCKQTFLNTYQSQEIVFKKDGEGITGLYVMDTEGKNEICILRTNKKNSTFGFPYWSPDGEKIAFSFGEMKEDGSRISDIYIMDINSKNPIRITKDIIAGQIVWFPDGEKIIFEGTDQDGENKIYIMNVNGKNQKNVINSFGRNTILGLSCSPDGKRIIFASNKNENYDIYMMNINGSNLVSLTNTPTDECTPTYSPNGKKIVFCSIDGLYIIDTERKNLKKIIDSSLLNGGPIGPSWAPDGKRIAFTAWGEGGGDIFIVNVNGKNLKNLTKTKNFGEWYPSWQPIPKH